MNKLIFGIVLLGTAVLANADPIALNTDGGQVANGVGYGQSVTTPNGNAWDHLSFNFFGSDRNPYARGGLYILTEAYSGSPAGLSSSTAGYLGFTTTTDNQFWNFTDVTLNGGTQYFFYMDSIVPVGSGIMIQIGTGAYAGGGGYGSGGPGTYVAVEGFDTLFSLTGNPVSDAPEPGTLAMLAGAAVIATVARRRI